MSIFDSMQEIKSLSDAILKPDNEVLAGRLRLSLTQAELAPLLGVSVRTIQDYEQGRCKPSKAVLMLLNKELEK